MNRRGFFGMLTGAIIASKVEVFGEEETPQFERRKFEGEDVGQFGGPLANPHQPGTIEYFLHQEADRLTEYWTNQFKKP
jgi:hypothetical protein